MSKPTLAEVFDALSSDSSMDGCDPDWRASILSSADVRDREKVRDAFLREGTESEVEFRLGIRR